MQLNVETNFEDFNTVYIITTRVINIADSDNDIDFIDSIDSEWKGIENLSLFCQNISLLKINLHTFFTCNLRKK